MPAEAECSVLRDRNREVGAVVKLVSSELEPADQPGVNRLVVGNQTLMIEHFEPLGDVRVETPSGYRTLRHAASAEVRCRSGHAVYLYGECAGHLMGARAS